METLFAPNAGRRLNEQEIEIEVQYKNDGLWYKTDVTVDEYALVMNTGMLENNMLFAVSVFSIGDVVMIYDFGRLTGTKQWRIE